MKYCEFYEELLGEYLKELRPIYQRKRKPSQYGYRFEPDQDLARIYFDRLPYDLRVYLGHWSGPFGELLEFGTRNRHEVYAKRRSRQRQWMLSKWGGDYYYPRDGAYFRERVPLRITEKKQLSEEEKQKREWKAKKRSRKYPQRGPTWQHWSANRSMRHQINQGIREGKWDPHPKLKWIHFDSYDWY
jgi:hypothetical protein